MVTELADQAYVGTALTLQLALGFTLTVVDDLADPGLRGARPAGAGPSPSSPPARCWASLAMAAAAGLARGEADRRAGAARPAVDPARSLVGPFPPNRGGRRKPRPVGSARGSRHAPPEALGLGLRGPAARPRRAGGDAPRRSASGSASRWTRSRSPCRWTGSSCPSRGCKPPERSPRLFSADPYDRVCARARQGLPRRRPRASGASSPNPPDLVAHPESAEDVDLVLSFADEARRRGDPVRRRHQRRRRRRAADRRTTTRASVSDRPAARMDRVLEVDAVSRAARIQAGATGPVLEDQLREHGLTLRHFPQSFEYSTLGGWIATRAGGHFATLYTHIDDLVESVRARDPGGRARVGEPPPAGLGRRAQPRPPAAGLRGDPRRDRGRLGAGPGAPALEASCGVAFDDFASGAEAVRELAQSGLHPSNCRLLDPVESAITSAGPPGKALLVLGFESAHHPVDESMRLALDVAARARRRSRARCAPRRRGRRRRARRSDSVGAWRHAFLHAPYLRDSLVACGVLSDTFETAITWDRFADFHAEVMEAARKAVARRLRGPRRGAGAPRIGCRFTHVYPDGPAPYYTVLRQGAARLRGRAVGRDQGGGLGAVIDCGGTITHHHAVGRDHRPWYDRQRPDAVRGGAARRQVRARSAGRFSTPASWSTRCATESARVPNLASLMEGTTLEQTPRVSEEPTAPDRAPEAPPRPSARRDRRHAPAGVGQEPARVRGPAVLGPVRRGQRGPRRDRHLPRLLRGRLGRLPDQRRPRRRGGPPAPEEALPPDRRGRAQHPHRDRARRRA